MDIRQMIKETALKIGMDLCGIADISRFEESIKPKRKVSSFVVNLFGF